MPPIIDESKLNEFLRTAIFEILDKPVDGLQFSVRVGGQQLNLVLMVESADLRVYSEVEEECPILLPS